MWRPEYDNPTDEDLDWIVGTILVVFIGVLFGLGFLIGYNLGGC